MRWSAPISSPPTPTKKHGGLFTTQQMSFAGIRRGARGLSKPPIDDIDSFWTPEEKADVGRMLSRSIVGSPETVRRGLEVLAGETGADEIMLVSDVYDHAKRLKSIALIAEAAGMTADATLAIL